MRYVLIVHEVNYENTHTREDRYTNRVVFGASRDGESKEDFIVRQKEKIGDRMIWSTEEARTFLENDPDSVFDIDEELDGVEFVTVVGPFQVHEGPDQFDITGLYVLHEVED